MNRQQYKNIRRLIRDNGLYALRWFDASTIRIYDTLIHIEASTDRLAERQDIVAYCKREGIKYNFRHLAN